MSQFLSVIFKAMKKYGECIEALWPFEEQKFSQKPLTSCYHDGLRNSIVKYTHLDQDIHQFRVCFKDVYPFTVGFEI